MKFDVYTREDGAYVLIPEGTNAFAESQSVHGPLTFCEAIVPHDYPFPAIWQTVFAELERHSHAVLPEAIGRRLMGLDCKDDHANGEKRAASA